MSCRAMVAPCSSGKSKTSVSRFLVKTTLPAPTNAILVILGLLDLELRPELRQPPRLRLQHLVHHRVDLGQGAHGGREGVQHHRVMRRLGVAG